MQMMKKVPKRTIPVEKNNSLLNWREKGISDNQRSIKNHFLPKFLWKKSLKNKAVHQNLSLKFWKKWNFSWWFSSKYSECTSEGRDLFDILYKKRQMFSFGICYSPHFCLHNQYFVSLRPSEKKEKEPLFFSKNSGEIHWFGSWKDKNKAGHWKESVPTMKENGSTETK
jgi:hypothetical protein